MNKRLIEEGFHRRYVLLPMLLAIAVVVLGYWITEMRRTQEMQLTEGVRQRQEVIRLLGQVLFDTMQAESAQRGFLLTGEEKYLPPLDTGLTAAEQGMAQLQKIYLGLEPAQLPVLKQIHNDLDAKAQEMHQTVALLKAATPHASLALVKSDLGLQLMASISKSLESMRAHERHNVTVGLDNWKHATRINSAINIGNMIFGVSILLLLGLLVTRDIRRREGFAKELAGEIDERTAELRDLSQHMSEVAEAEKHALARELHDELGGVLVAMRMDLSRLRKQLGTNDDPTLQARWERVDQALSQGMELKRRVIEDLRPTLLDNMGLFTALRWLVTERGEQAQLALRMEGLNEDIELPQNIAIAVFRAAQEAIANVTKHAGASNLEVTAMVGAGLRIEIADDGCGMPAQTPPDKRSHGLKQMLFRMEAIGGDLQISARVPRGTSVVLSVPLTPTQA